MSSRDHERFGFLLNPDLTYRRIIFDVDHASDILGPRVLERTRVAFAQNDTQYEAIYSPEARLKGEEPNPVASMAANLAATDNASFLQDPASAISGPVIFVGVDGSNIDDGVVEQVKDAIRAVLNYQEDFPEEYELWYNASLNMGMAQD